MTTTPRKSKRECWVQCRKSKPLGITIQRFRPQRTAQHRPANDSRYTAWRTFVATPASAPRYAAWRRFVATPAVATVVTATAAAPPPPVPQSATATEEVESKAMPRTKHRVARVVGNTIVLTFCLLLVVGSLLFALNQDPKKSLFGYRFYNVLTGSMTPGPDSPPGGFSAGDMIFVKLGDPATIKVGDIVTYATDQSGSASLTHRVVDIKTEMDGQPGLWFITRGDTNNADDPPVSADRIIGTKVFSIPKLGAMLQQVRNNPIPYAVFAVAALCLVFVLHGIFSASKKKRSAQVASSAQPNDNLPLCKAVDIDTNLPNGKVHTQTI